MAYVLADDNGYLGEGPTIQGLEDLHEWAADKPVIKQFLEDGVTADTNALAEALTVAEGHETIDEIKAALLDAATSATGPLMLSEGEE